MHPSLSLTSLWSRGRKANHAFGWQLAEELLEMLTAFAKRQFGQELFVRVHQQVWIIEGAMELTVGNERPQRLEVGDCLAMQLDVPMVFRNPTRKPARYIVVIVSELSRGMK